MGDVIETAASEVWIALGKSSTGRPGATAARQISLLGAHPGGWVVEAEESDVSQTQHQELHGRLREQDAPGEALVDGEF